MSVKIFVMTHKPFTQPPDPMYVPLHVGRANAADLGLLGDDTGDSISSYNPYFCELTGMYWLWKNYHASDYIGVCHYRRYLIQKDGSIFTEQNLKHLLTKYDMVTTKLLTLTGTYYDGFSQNHHIKDLITTGEVLTEKYPDYAQTFEQLVHGSQTFFGNIFVTSKDTYDCYCAWLFDILFEVQKRTDFTGYNDYHKRLFGFLSEFLQTVFIARHQFRVYECKVGMSGEKYETRMLRKALADFFAKRDYNGAKDCFLAAYQKRPDVLMEASDITGELHICMQIISTCSFEDEAFHRCILDNIRDYDRLITHFHRLNMAVSHFLAEKASADDRLFLKNNRLITPVAIDIAVKMFCKQKALHEKISKQIWDCI